MLESQSGKRHNRAWHFKGSLDVVAMRAQTVHTEQGVIRVVGAGAVVLGQLPYVLRPAVAHGCH
jgi:hypothetical protein